VLLGFSATSSFKAESACLGEDIWIVGEHLHALCDDFVGVSVVLETGVHSADLEGDHDVLRLAVVLPWECPKELVDFDIDVVPDCPVALLFRHRWLLPLQLGDLFLLFL